jgi:hypothetical protein
MSDTDKKDYIRDMMYDNEIYISVGSFDYKVLVD